MSKVTHVEIHADNTERAVEFYRNVFGWMISPKSAGDEEYWLIFNGGAISGGIRPRLSANVATVPQIQVDSVDQVSAKIVKCGGKALPPKKKIPGTGYLLYCQDSEGNLFAILEKSYATKD